MTTFTKALAEALEVAAYLGRHDLVEVPETYGERWFRVNVPVRGVNGRKVVQVAVRRSDWPAFETGKAWLCGYETPAQVREFAARHGRVSYGTEAQ